MTLEKEVFVPGKLLTRIPGRAQSQAEAMSLYREGVAKLQQRLVPALWPIFIPQAETLHRWRAQLECGCVHEIFVEGEERFPDERRYEDPITDTKLPAGEFWCTNEHAEVAPVYRHIVEWVHSEVREFPADPEEPVYEWMDAETWAKVREPEPHSSAFWRVKLVCEHVSDSVVADVSWRPEDGPRLTTPERAAEMRRDFEESWTRDPTGWPEVGPDREHVIKMLDLCWPRPEPEQECRTCRYAMRITGYQRIGPLLAPARPVPTPAEQAEAKKRTVEARLAAAEAEVQRLRAELDAGDIG